MIKGCKSNIFTKGKNEHFWYSGSYYSFGDKSFYRKIGDSSIDSYKPRSFKNINRNILSVTNVELIETLCSTEVKNAVMKLKMYWEYCMFIISCS